MNRSVPAVDEIVLPLILILSTCSAVSVPREVMDGCAAVVTVAAVVAAPLSAPLKVVVVRTPALYVSPATPSMVVASVHTAT